MDIYQDSTLAICVYGDKSLALRRMLDGELIAEVPLGHSVLWTTSMNDMIVTIGLSPSSLNIINDRLELDRQFIELPRRPEAVAISPAQDTIAVMLDDGLSLCMVTQS